jgi:hypothetical protein
VDGTQLERALDSLSPSVPADRGLPRVALRSSVHRHRLDRALEQLSDLEERIAALREKEATLGRR